MKDLIWTVIIFGGGYYYYVNNTNEIDRERHLKTTFEFLQDTKEKIGFIDEENLYNNNLVPLYNSIYPKGIEKLVQNENLRFESYTLIREANEKLIKYISHNNATKFSNDAKEFILLQEEYLEILSTNYNFLSQLFSSSKSNNIGILVEGIINKEELTKVKNRLESIANDSKILMGILSHLNKGTVQNSVLITEN